MERYVGRNITHKPVTGKWIVTTEVNGKTQLVDCNNKALAEATMRRLKRSGYHYFDAHKDITI